MSNNGFKAISESLITDIFECPITRGELGTFTYLMLKANYVTHKALGSFSGIAEDLKVNVRQIARDCYNLRDYGWIDFEVKQGQRKPIKFTILKGWWDNEHTTQSQHGNNSQVSPKSVPSQSQVSPKSDVPPDASGSVPMPNSADSVFEDNTEHGTWNMKQQRPRRKKGNLESPDDEDVVVSNFCYEEENSADLGRKESPYEVTDASIPPFPKGGRGDFNRFAGLTVAELCELFANSYGQSLPQNKAQE